MRMAKTLIGLSVFVVLHPGWYGLAQGFHQLFLKPISCPSFSWSISHGPSTHVKHCKTVRTQLVGWRFRAFPGVQKCKGAMHGSRACHRMARKGTTKEGWKVHVQLKKMRRSNSPSQTWPSRIRFEFSADTFSRKQPLKNNSSGCKVQVTRAGNVRTYVQPVVLHHVVCALMHVARGFGRHPNIRSSIAPPPPVWSSQVQPRTIKPRSQSLKNSREHSFSRFFKFVQVWGTWRYSRG